MKKFLSLLVLASAYSLNCYALDLAVVGTGTFHSVALDSTTQSQLKQIGFDLSSGFGVGFGALVGVPVIFPGFKLETGLLYLTRQYSLSDGNSADTLTARLHSLEIPAVLRFEVLSIASVGAGLYYAKSVGQVSCVGSNCGGITPSSYSDAGLKTSEVGLVLSGGVKIPVALTPFSVLTDVRVTRGLTNMLVDQTGGVSQKYNDVQILLGLNMSL